MMQESYPMGRWPVEAALHGSCGRRSSKHEDGAERRSPQLELFMLTQGEQLVEWPSVPSSAPGGEITHPAS